MSKKDMVSKIDFYLTEPFNLFQPNLKRKYATAIPNTSVRIERTPPPREVAVEVISVTIADTSI